MTASLRGLEKVDAACPHCGAASAETLWTGREHEYAHTTDEEFAFLRCASCGLVRLNPRPAISELGRIYPSDYYAYNLLSGAAEGALSVTDRAKRRMYQGRFRALVDRLGPRSPVRVLDVGCADGRLLDWYTAGHLGNRLETHGIELNEAAADTARRRGHRVVTGRFEIDQELEAGAFDLILASHVIEHVEDPELFARRAAELLAPGGLLVVATPNWSSADAVRFRGHWGGNHFPRHWTLYDERTMRSLAEAVDLDLEKVEYQPNPIFWVWTCHSWLSGRFPNRSWPDRVFPPVGIFDSSLRSFALQSFFSGVDFLLRAATGRTASMAAHLRKAG